jgi:predicted glycosyltransferase
MSPRVLFHVNHLWGVGHFSRIAAIANAVVGAGGNATVLCGNRPLAGRLRPDVRLIELPHLRSPDATYAGLVDANGNRPDAALWQARADIIDAELAAAPPDVVVTETFPFGRRKLSAELLHLIAAAKSYGAAVVSSIRDLPTPPHDQRRLDECAIRLRDHYDLVLVHGDPAIIGLQDVWPGEMPVRVAMTGYVGVQPESVEQRRGVIVSAGGGGDATAVLDVAMRSRKAGLLPDEPWTFVTGPNAAHLVDRLRADAPANTEILVETPDLPRRIASARLSISRGGYNTMIETVAAGTPAVIIPHAPPGEPEQETRARLFAAQGLVSCPDEAGLTPESLAERCVRLLSQTQHSAHLDLNGAARSASLLAELAEGR